MPNTNEIIATIGAIQTLIENFPMSIFTMFGNKVYSNPLEFILDVLKQLGVSNEILVNKLIELFFDVPNAIEIYGNISNFTYKRINKPTKEQIEMSVVCSSIPEPILPESPNYICVDNVYYVKKRPLPAEPQSKFFNSLEFSVKGIIHNILTGLLSCSIIPEIPEKYMDTNIEPHPDERIIFSKSSFDLFNMLSINPVSDIGKNYYSDVDDLDLTVNDLYKVNDLNAFLWYVINRGNTITQTEKNKMMWDSRITAQVEGKERDNRQDNGKWDEWMNSKSGNFDIFSFNGDNRYPEATADTKNTTIDLPLHPILQFKQLGSGVEITFPAQTWHKESGIFNKSIYTFNYDYLKNIQIFNPRLIITEMIDSLLNGSLLHTLNPNYSIETQFFEAKINEIIKQALEVEDLSVDDCFYSFSNEEFNSALKEMELQKYGAKELNSETSPAIKIDSNIGIDSLNEINSMATINEKLNTISRTVYNIAAIPTQDAAIEISDKFSLGYNEKWINDVVMALVMPLAKSIFTPKVMLLFLIDFHVIGLINLNDIQSLDGVMDLIVKKMIAIIISLVKYIKDKIVVFLLDLYYKYIEPMLIKWGIKVLTEKLQAWLDLLEEAIRCLPFFDFSNYKVLTEIDDVNYADITQEQNIPESENKC